MYSPATPISDSATTITPETAPPRMATSSASETDLRAADAVLMLARTEIAMPTMPAIAEQSAPRMNPMLVLIAISELPV